MKALNLRKIPEKLPLIPITGSVIFPGGESTVRINGHLQEWEDDNFKASTDEMDNYALALSVRKNFNLSDLSEEDFFKIGTLVKIEKSEKKTAGLQIKVRGLERTKIENIHKEDHLYTANYTIIQDEVDMEESNLQELLNYIKEVAIETAEYFEGAKPIIAQIKEYKDPSELSYFILPFLNISRTEKQEFLEISSVKQRGLKFLDYVVSQKESIKVQAEMAQKISDSSSKKYRENILREQLKSIQAELNQGRENKNESMREKIESAPMPSDVKEMALEELDKLEAQGSNNPDSHIIKNYLDLLLALPWAEPPEVDIDIDQAHVILDEEHYGLDKVKERIIQHLAVMKLKKGKKGSILLLAGPPGTGKTSLGKSVAKALGREFVRISLGGIRDEADIRGHRRTYVGALPGRIIQGMKKAGTRNPVFMLDEVDKLMRGFSGDPASALLEVLDPEQNNSFADHYLEVPYDLSDVFFIATANSIETIPGPLLDRMEILSVSGYTNIEKFHIGKNHLVPRVLTDHGMDDSMLELSDEALTEVIEHYTREAGVRTLQRRLEALARSSSEKVIAKDAKLPLRITSNMVEEILGKDRVRHEEAGKNNPPGVVTGLAWTPVGGEILFIESTHMPGSGQLTLTGQLGDVMKESAQISRSLIRSRLPLFSTSFNFKESDLHVHVPSGAVPKDGPSAGVALFTSLASLVTGRQIDSKLAMTGEISLRGSVMPVGGIKEKVLAAHRAGIKKILLPKDNERDMKDIPQEVKDDIEFKLMSTVEEVIKEALGLAVPNPNEVLLDNNRMDTMA